MKREKKITSEGILVRKQAKLKIKRSERFLHAFPATKNDETYIGAKYPDYYDSYKDWNEQEEGSRFIVRRKRKRSEIDEKLKDEKSSEFESSKRLTQTYLGITRKLKRWLIASPIVTFFLMLVISLAINSIGGHFDRTMIWPWLYIVPVFAFAFFEFWFLLRRAYYYATFVVSKLRQNVEKQLTERMELQERAAENERVKSPRFLNYETYADDSASLKTDDDGLTRQVIGSLYTAIFNLKLHKDAHGLVRLDENARWPFLGIPITTFDLLTKDDVEFTRLNGFVSKNVWLNQKNPAFMRKNMNTGKLQAEPYVKKYAQMGDNDVKTEAFLLYKMAHTLLVAKTGAGKTGYVIMYVLIAILLSKDQPSIFFNSKGDDAKFIYSLALICGYNYVNLALNSPNTADKYNPLSEIWNCVYTMYALENEEISEINIPLSQYIQAYNFSLRKNSYSDKRDYDNSYYANNDGKAFIRYFKNSTNGDYLFNAEDILNEIVRQTEDYTLVDDIFRNTNYQLEKMEPEFFIRFFLAKYNRSRQKLPNYLIGKIVHNIAIPFLNDESMYDFWYKDGGWNTEKKWYLCGTYAFISKQFIFDNKEQILQKMNSQYHTAIDTLVPVLTGSDPDGAKGENAVFSDSAIGIIKFWIKVYCAKLLRDGPELAPEEYFTLQQITRAAKQLENKGYSQENEKINEYLVATQDEHMGEYGYDPYTRISNILRPFDQEIDNGFSTTTSRTADTWNGMFANVQTQLKKIGSDSLFSATCYSSFNLHLFYIQPTIIVTTASGKLNNVISIMFADLFNIWLVETEQSNKEPYRAIIFLLDEFSTIKWDNEPLFEHLQDGRSRRMFVIIIAQTRLMIEEKQGKTLLDSAKVNGLLRLSLGEATQEDAQTTSNEMGSYTGTNFSGIKSQDDLSDLDKLTVKENIPYISANDVLSAGLGKKFGKLDLVEKSGVYFEFQDKVYYSSQTQEIIKTNPLFKQVAPPKFDFAPLSYQLRFDYGINVLYYSVEESATQEHSFTKRFQQIFLKTHELTSQKQSDENLVPLNTKTLSKWQSLGEKLIAQNNAVKKQNTINYAPEAAVQEFALTFTEKSLDEALLERKQMFVVNSK